MIKLDLSVRAGAGWVLWGMMGESGVWLREVGRVVLVALVTEDVEGVVGDEETTGWGMKKS